MLVPSLLSLLFFAHFGASKNVTIDDQFGDEATGRLVEYSPAGDAWAQGSTCTTCALEPAPQLAFNGTWHDSTVGALPNEAPGPYTFTLLFDGT